jgi:hypothetical protein
LSKCALLVHTPIFLHSHQQEKQRLDTSSNRRKSPWIGEICAISSALSTFPYLISCIFDKRLSIFNRRRPNHLIKHGLDSMIAYRFVLIMAFQIWCCFNIFSTTYFEIIFPLVCTHKWITLSWNSHWAARNFGEDFSYARQKRILERRNQWPFPNLDISDYCLSIIFLPNSSEIPL